MGRKVFSCVLALCICLALLPMLSRNAAAYDYTWFNSKVAEIKRDYPEGTAWSNANSYPSGWSGCWAFANIMAERIFGYSTPGNSWGTVDIDSILPGDILRSSSHTMFVIGVSGDDITLAEGNYGRENHIIHYDRVTTKADARNESFTVYRAPNYNEVIGRVLPAPPQKPTVSVNGANVTVSWRDVADETSYNVYLVQAPWGWEDIKYRATVGKNVTSYTFTGIAPGTYSAFVISMPNGTDATSPWTSFSVVYPAPTGKPSVTVSGTRVRVSWNDVANETSYNVYLVQAPWGWEDIKYRATVQANVTEYTFTNVKEGKYSAFIISMPNDTQTQSKWTEFSVSEAITVYFSANGGGGTMSSRTVTSGGSLTLPSCGFTAPSGKRFKAWSIGGREYAAGASYTVTGNTTVTAVWEIIPNKFVSVSRTAGGVSAVVSCGVSGARVMCAAYGADGRLLGTEAKPVTVGESSYTLSVGAADHIRVFMLDADFRPLCESISL